MILRSLHIAGFGRLVDRRFEFRAGLNVIHGPNESGKSTLANAIVATLYGVDRRKEYWRPWSGAGFITTLVYRLANGEHIEVQRDFDRDAKGLRVYDRNGNDISARLGGHRLVPGEAHLGVPLDVFLNGACAKQQAIAIEAGKDTAPIAAHLARALDGGPREDAALGAIARLDEALKRHVGTDRARKNAPLREQRAYAAAQRAAISQARARLDALGDLRERLDHAAGECERLAVAAADSERRLRSQHAGAVRGRLADLHTFRAELAELQAERARYADVADLDTGAHIALNAAFVHWEAAVRAADAAQSEADACELSAAEWSELERRRLDAGALDATTFNALIAADGRARDARTEAIAASQAAAAARTDGRTAISRNVTSVAAAVAICVFTGFAIAHSWTWSGVTAAIALGALLNAMSEHRRHARRERNAREKQHVADNALRAEHTAANAVTAVLDPLGIRTFEELLARRLQLSELLGRRHAAEVRLEHARTARGAAQEAAKRFDALAANAVPGFAGDRSACRAAAERRFARKRECAGLDAHLHALELRKLTILGSDDEYALEAELAAIERFAASDDRPYERGVSESERGVSASERGALLQQLRIARERHSRLAGELTGAQTQLPDLAALDEQLARTEADISRLVAFERAILLAKSTLERRTQEAHQAFARRLEDYAAGTLHAITAGRYGELFVDPATLTIRLRVPETGALVQLDSLSAGTRDQAYLVVRLAIARMFAEGMEAPPLLLDDPFAYWDAARIARCLPIIEHRAREAQALLFTASLELAEAAERNGAHRIDLLEPALV